jgi:tetratricopeptide (TPR) repeat protein
LHHFENAYDGGSGQIAAGFNLAHLQLIMGNAAAAEGIFGSLKRSCDGCLDARIGIALAYNKQHKYPQAKEAFLAVLDKNPGNPVALYRLALIEKNGFDNPAAAMEYLRRILADNSNSGLSIKRQANNLLNSMQAAEVGKEMTAQTQSRDNDEKDEADVDVSVESVGLSTSSSQSNEAQ